jgi:hypothetical protein
MTDELLSCPDCGSRNIKTLATTRDRDSAVEATIIGLKCRDCGAGFAITVERLAATKSRRATREHAFEHARG